MKIWVHALCKVVLIFYSQKDQQLFFKESLINDIQCNFDIWCCVRNMYILITMQRKCHSSAVTKVVLQTLVWAGGNMWNTELVSYFFFFSIVKMLLKICCDKIRTHLLLLNINMTVVRSRHDSDSFKNNLLFYKFPFVYLGSSTSCLCLVSHSRDCLFRLYLVLLFSSLLFVLLLSSFITVAVCLPANRNLWAF